jgi:hypothetical protein
MWSESRTPQRATRPKTSSARRVRAASPVPWSQAAATNPGPQKTSPDVRFEATELEIEPGDVFVFYTDGITEATDPAGVDFGEARLLSAAVDARDSAAAVVAAVHEAAARFRGGAPPGDDATVIAARVPPGPARP